MHYLEPQFTVSFCGVHCLSTVYFSLLKAVEMLQRVYSSSPFLSLAMALTQLLVFSVCLSALVGRGAPFMDKRSMSDVEERLKKLKDLPGFDPEEYKRYWEEMVKNDPRKSIWSLQESI